MYFQQAGVAIKAQTAVATLFVRPSWLDIDRVRDVAA